MSIMAEVSILPTHHPSDPHHDYRRVSCGACEWSEVEHHHWAEGVAATHIREVHGNGVVKTIQTDTNPKVREVNPSE